MKQISRVQQTETLIEQTFLQLVEERGFANVKLVDIAERANLNRNTIYLRYGTKEDIINSLIQRTYDRGYKTIAEDLKTHVRNRRTVERLVRTIFDIMEQDQELYRIVINDVNLTGYLNKLISTARNDIMSHIKDTKQNKVIVEYIVNGTSGVIRNWITYDTCTKEENIKIVTNLLLSCMRGIAF